MKTIPFAHEIDAMSSADVRNALADVMLQLSTRRRRGAPSICRWNLMLGGKSIADGVEETQWLAKSSARQKLREIQQKLHPKRGPDDVPTILDLPIEGADHLPRKSKPILEAATLDGGQRVFDASMAGAGAQLAFTFG